MNAHHKQLGTLMQSEDPSCRQRRKGRQTYGAVHFRPNGHVTAKALHGDAVSEHITKIGKLLETTIPYDLPLLLATVHLH